MKKISLKRFTVHNKYWNFRPFQSPTEISLKSIICYFWKYFVTCRRLIRGYQLLRNEQKWKFFQFQICPNCCFSVFDNKSKVETWNSSELENCLCLSICLFLFCLFVCLFVCIFVFHICNFYSFVPFLSLCSRFGLIVSFFYFSSFTFSCSVLVEQMYKNKIEKMKKRKNEKNEIE